jgi:hypothetical protein
MLNSLSFSKGNGRLLPWIPYPASKAMDNSSNPDIVPA